MDKDGNRDPLELVREALKGEEDAVFMFGASKPDGKAMETLSSAEASEVEEMLDKLLRDTESHRGFLEEMVKKYAEEPEGTGGVAPVRMRFLPQFEGLFKIESEMLLLHIDLFQKYLEKRGFDRWARGLQSILRDEFEHVKMTGRLLGLAVSIKEGE